ncbi:MAG: hybrid sensor histidine kinase/response regulator, partial [Flavobacterium sp.]
ILEFSKSENKSLEFLPSKINLKSDIEHIVESLKILAENKGINLDMEVDQTLDEFFWTDTVKIHQLFFNLIGNAIKFTDKGYVKVNAQNFQNQLTVSIEDTGIGIPKEDISKIFDQFYQTSNADFRSNLGAGLGLHLCKEIVTLLKGSLDIESDYGQGSKISFTIPLEKYVDHNTCYLDRLKEKLAAKPINIALIDDDKLSIQLLNKILKPLNQNISLFDSLESFFNENIATFGLVLTDLNLKDGSGWDIAQRLKQQEDQNSIVIIVTGDSYWESADVEELPADEVLIKPVNKEELYKKIESLI